MANDDEPVDVPARCSRVEPWVISSDTDAEIAFLTTVLEGRETPGSRMLGPDGRIGHVAALTRPLPSAQMHAHERKTGQAGARRLGFHETRDNLRRWSSEGCRSSNGVSPVAEVNFHNGPRSSVGSAT